MASFEDKTEQSGKCLRQIDFIFRDGVKEREWFCRLRERGLISRLSDGSYFPWTRPVPLPSYLIAEACGMAEAYLAFLRRYLSRDRVEETLCHLPLPSACGAEIREWIHGYYTRSDPHLTFDFLIVLRDSRGREINTRDLPQSAVRELVEKKEAALGLRLLECQAIDSYQFGWFANVLVPALKGIYGIPSQKSWFLCAEDEIRASARSLYHDGLFLEHEPSKQVTKGNLALICSLTGRNEVFDLKNISGREGRPFISRLVDDDLRKAIADFPGCQVRALAETLNDPRRWVSPAFHPFSYYWGNKAALVPFWKVYGGDAADEILPGGDADSVPPPGYVLKPLSGHSAQGIVFGGCPDGSGSRGGCMIQKIIHPARILPNHPLQTGLNADADKGVGCEARFLFSATPSRRYRAGLACVMTRTSYVSTDPLYRVPNTDTGWFTNVRAILAALRLDLGVDTTRPFLSNTGCGIAFQSG